MTVAPMVMPKDEIAEVVRDLKSYLYSNPLPEETSDGYLTRTLVVLTGAGGFLGRWLVPVLSGLYAKVLAIESNPQACEDIRAASGNVQVLEHTLGDTSGPALQREVLRCWVDMQSRRYEDGPPIRLAFIHMAGIASPQQYQANQMMAFSLGTSRVLAELAACWNAALVDTNCALPPRYLFFSSSEIYGNPEPSAIPTPESYPGRVSSTGDRSCYDEGKRAGEALAMIYHRTHGLHTNIVRPFNVYGPGMLPTDYRVMPNFATALLRGKPMQVYGNGRQTRTYCYVTDFIRGVVLLLCAGKPGEAYNIGNPAPEVSVEGLAERFHKAAINVLGRTEGFERVRHPAEYPSDEPARRCPDISKAIRDFGYVPRVDLDDGLRRFLSWASQEPRYAACQVRASSAEVKAQRETAEWNMAISHEHGETPPSPYYKMREDPECEPKCEPKCEDPTWHKEALEKFCRLWEEELAKDLPSCREVYEQIKHGTALDPKGLHKALAEAKELENPALTEVLGWLLSPP